MHLTARDLMNPDVISARQDMTVHQLMVLLETNRITGVPVLDDEGALVGVVSASDIAIADEDLVDREPPPSDYHHDAGGPAGDLEELTALPPEGVGDLLVGQIMSRRAVTANLDTPVRHLAATMHRQHIHRVIIVDGRRIAGIVSSLDVLRAVAEGQLR